MRIDEAYRCETSDVDAREECRYAWGWFVGVTEPLEAGIWNGNAGFFRVYGSVWKVCSICKVCDTCQEVGRTVENVKVPVSERTLKKEDLPTLGSPWKKAWT